jgi:hypothetical protein
MTDAEFNVFVAGLNALIRGDMQTAPDMESANAALVTTALTPARQRVVIDLLLRQIKQLDYEAGLANEYIAQLRARLGEHCKPTPDAGEEVH